MNKLALQLKYTIDRFAIYAAPQRSAAYLKNAYRVLPTRARQAMVIVIPPGDPVDPTRKPEYYDSTFAYLKEIGFQVIQASAPQECHPS
jgi:hypothetical protein